MAKTIEEILGKSINSTKELRAAIKELQDQLVSAEAGTQEWADTADKLTAAQAKLNEVMSAGKSGIDAVEDSIVGMEKRYKELYNTYKLLSEEQRNSPFGREMADELENLSTKLNETKKGVGNFKDNIGRYAQDAVAAFSTMGVSIGGLATPLGLANGGFKALNATMKANPIFWIITAIQVIIGLFNKLKDAVMSNEESQMAWNEAMSAFQPITDAVSNAFDKLGQVVVKVVGWIADAFRKVREIKAAITDFLGITDGEQKRIQEQNKLYKELSQRTNELTKAKREQQVLNAKEEAQVKILLDEAAATANATEKMKLLNEAKALQEGITARNIAIAEEEYNLLLEKSKLTANDAATNDKLAQAEAKVYQARAEGASKTKEMNSQITSLTKQTDKYAEALKKEKDELDNLLKTIDENSKTEIQKLEAKYNKELALLKKYGKDTTELTRQYAIARAEAEVEAYNEAKSRLQGLVSGAYGEDSEQNLRLNMDIAAKEYGRAKNMVDNVQSQIKTYQEQGRISAETITGVWEKVAAKLGGAFEGITTWEEAVAALKGLEKVSNDAKKAYEQFLTDTVLNQNASAALEKETEAYERRMQVMNDSTLSEFDRAVKLKEIDDELLQSKIDNLQFELDALDLTNQQKLEKTAEYYDALKQQRERDAQAAAELDALKYDNNINLIDSNIAVLDSIGAITDAISQNIERTMEDGDETEESVKKKKKALKTLQDIQMAVTIAAIAADTAAGIMGIWRGYALEKIANAETAAATGPAAAATLAALNTKSLVSAILQTTAMGVMGAAQIASAVSGTISNKNAIDGGESGGSAAGTMATPAVIETNPYSYTRQIQTTEEEDALNRPIFVSVTDIESGLNHAKVVDNESSW